MAIKHMRLFCVAALVLLMTGCNAAQQRGMLGSAYVSTTRPAISLEAKNMPLLTAGQGSVNLTWSGMMGGLPIRVWLAVYGTGDISPMAVVAQAEVPQGWYWDGIMRRPFSVDEGVEVFDGVGYQACTYIVDNGHDPFGALVADKTTTGQPVRWLARGLGSSGSTPIPPRCSWATWGRSGSAACWPFSRCFASRNCSCSSWAACSWRKPSP